jgi:WS/DGAT/MGAT family acyltransferase
MERLTSLAAAFLEAEDADPAASLAIGSLAIFEGPAPAFEDFVSTIAGRLPLVPRYRQKLRTVPLRLAAPAWVDDPDFDVHWHVRSTALPAPGGAEAIGRLMSRVMTRRMDRTRPLWEYWFCEGLSGGRWALLSKLHHSMVDGVAGTDLYQHMLDPSATPRPPVVDTWTAGAPSGAVPFAASGLWDLATLPLVGVRAAAHAVRSPVQLASGAARTARGLMTLAGALTPVDDSSLNGSLDGSRRYVWTDVSLTDLKAPRSAFGATVNDVALAAVTGGFRSLLLSRGEEPSAHMLRTLVPVSTRAPGSPPALDNRVSLMLPYLPVDLCDARERLAAVQRRVRALRTGREPEAGGAMTAAADHGPFSSVALGIRLGMRLPQHQISTVTTNVPGPRTTLYSLGREVQELLPYVPIASRVRIGIAIFSYRDTLTFAITGDYDTTPDIQVLADGISASVHELVLAAVEQSGQPPGS